MIKLENIDKVYRTKTVETLALQNVSINVGKGEFVSVMGPSGSGKSTLLNIMGLLDEPTKGVVSVEGNIIKAYRDKEIAKMRNRMIGFVFQSYHLIRDLSVLDNVQIPLLYRNMPSKERKQLAHKALDRVGLSARKEHFPSQLSGGQSQRVAIARAIIGNPEIILADEPTGNLDSTMGNEILDILIDLNKNESTTIIMVTHDERMADKSERIIRFFDGCQVN
ncbi:MAG: ABC transporter ATP-binding protein [Melioribacteraceae bacterium]|nr:ABC transporter ATP-binding protein [Melioribacteraceae bacterium]MCF8355589.1 ABC transporter ATP-binding protein [Melioribacteraceae bacterium]MCF8395032.1 ABC transporter ATP-binding protein [Melioribacteraceae bacterium]MCF8420486.1 ABC transporter ATP-binding protein [Melioribacteraceae bacterium]